LGHHALWRQAIAYAADGELAEVMPKSIRPTRHLLNPNARKRAQRAAEQPFRFWWAAGSGSAIFSRVDNIPPPKPRANAARVGGEQEVERWRRCGLRF
jgi:hypothetical protein